MKKQAVEFAVQSKDKIVQRVGRSSILQPQTNSNCKGVKWFDDNKLLKANRK